MSLPFSGLSLHLQLPDLWQQEAIAHLKAGADVVVDAPTGAGKTFIFELLHQQRGIRGQSVYTVPTRALANDKRAEWREKGWNVGIATGDVAENLGAPVIVATLETQLDRFLRREGPALLVIDEYQMLADARRGVHYEMAVALADERTQLLFLSGSVSNGAEVVEWMRRLGRKAEHVRHLERPVPLDEMPVEGLPIRAPAKLKGYWPRLAAEVLLADLGPLLIFAPQRPMAEKIARQIATGLPAPDHPLALSPAQKALCGSELTGLLEQRVAWHHSGLSYAIRAGIIEPLAKAGQLRVIVATMGLAAGINFSVRSVHIAETSFYEGTQRRDLRPDELLQMYGRAGRRGLDESGTAIATSRSPHLSEAAPKRLRRANELGWPELLRVMDAASVARHSDGETSVVRLAIGMASYMTPFDAARDLCDRLFSRQKILLGFENQEHSAAASLPENSDPMFGLRAMRREVLNSRREWELFEPTRQTTAPLSELHAFDKKGRWRPAETVAAFMEAQFSKIGRLCHLPAHGEGENGAAKRYGVLLPMARVQEDGLLQPARGFVSTKNRRHHVTMFELENRLLPQWLGQQNGAAIADRSQTGDWLNLRLAFSAVPFPAYRDQHGLLLYEPEQREIPVEDAADVRESHTGPSIRAAPGSAARAWRKLGLIEPDGTPTRRGRIFSFFHGGEGLAVAAALEDKSYPVDELVWHLANLRGGYRFEIENLPLTMDAGGGERLAAACRAAFGVVNHEGYLLEGLPVGYGEGTSEVLQDALKRGWPGRKWQESGDILRAGDLERAFVEWQSLLRQIIQAPMQDENDAELESKPWDRWMALCEAARQIMATLPVTGPTAHLPALAPAQRQNVPPHRLHLSRFGY